MWEEADCFSSALTGATRPGYTEPRAARYGAEIVLQPPALGNDPIRIGVGSQRQSKENRRRIE